MYKPELNMVVPTARVCLAEIWSFIASEAHLVWSNIIPHVSYHIPALRCFAYTLAIYALVIVPLVFLSKRVKNTRSRIIHKL